METRSLLQQVRMLRRLSRPWTQRRSGRNVVYHPDLTVNPQDGAVRVGWLEQELAFNRGRADPNFIVKLKRFYVHRVRQTRGFHLCPFCEEKRFGLSMEIDGNELTLGSAEIEVRDTSGKVYVAPDLIYHYITVHEYLPPSEFIAAVCK